MDPTYKTIANLFAVAQPDESEVLEVAETAKARNGRDAKESDELGRQCLTDGDVDNALRHFQRAVEQGGTDDVTSRIHLAGAYDFSDQAPQALRQYERALRVDRDAVEPVVGISDLYRRYGRFRDAIEKLEEAVAKEPKNPFFRIKLAETFRDAGERKQALLTAQQAVMLKPDEAFYHYWIGDLLTQMGEYEDALESLRAAIDLSPGDDYLYLRVSVPFWRTAKYAEALKAIRLASDLDPAKHFYHGLLGVLLEEMGQLDEAKLESNRAGKMDRYDHDTLGRIMDEMGIEP